MGTSASVSRLFTKAGGVIATLRGGTEAQRAHRTSERHTAEKWWWEVTGSEVGVLTLQGFALAGPMAAISVGQAIGHLRNLSFGLTALVNFFLTFYSVPKVNRWVTLKKKNWVLFGLVKGLSLFGTNAPDG